MVSHPIMLELDLHFAPLPPLPVLDTFSAVCFGCFTISAEQCAINSSACSPGISTTAPAAPALHISSNLIFISSPFFYLNNIRFPYHLRLILSHKSLTASGIYCNAPGTVHKTPILYIPQKRSQRQAALPCTRRRVNPHQSELRTSGLKPPEL